MKRVKRLLSKKLIFISSFLALSLSMWTILSGFPEGILCAKDQRTIECAAKHPSVTYVNEFQQYPVLDSAFDQISTNTCHDMSLLTATLTVAAQFSSMNAHYSEELSEILDKLLNQEPECLVKSAIGMDLKTRSIIGKVLRRMDSADSVSKLGGIRALKQFDGRTEYQIVLDDFRNSQIDEDGLLDRAPLLYVFFAVLLLAIIFALTETKMKIETPQSFLKSAIFGVIFFVSAVIGYVFSIILFTITLFLVLGTGLWLYDKNANSFSWSIALADLLTVAILIILLRSKRVRGHIVKTWREITGNM